MSPVVFVLNCLHGLQMQCQVNETIQSGITFAFPIDDDDEDGLCLLIFGHLFSDFGSLSVIT